MPKSNTFLGEILEEILYIEQTRRSICQELLLVRDVETKRKLAGNFLSCSLDKHEVLEQAVIRAMQVNDETVLEQLDSFYRHCEGKDLLSKIRSEIIRTQLYLDVIDRALDFPDTISFIERRLIKEIMKFVITQARCYNEIKPD